MFGWRCPSCQTRYFLRSSCAPCGWTITMAAKHRAATAMMARLLAMHRMTQEVLRQMDTERRDPDEAARWN